MKAIRTVGLMMGLVLLVPACGGAQKKATAVSTPPAGSPAGTERFYQQKVHWTSCEDGFQCAKVSVPLDYSRPSAGALKLAIIRKPALKPKERIGSLLVNPGGPGGSGKQFLTQAVPIFGASVQDRFDLVGFDPRGVGESDPVRCLDGKQLDQFFATDSSPDDQAEVTALAGVSQGFATGCKNRSGAELPYVGTVNAARDMDVLRAVLGDRQMSYYGASYGTYLGAFYADLFPGNVRALVLDGAVDPKLSATDLNLEQAKGFETALRSFAGQCVKTPNCPLGTDSVDSAVAKVSDLLKRVDAKPLDNHTGDGRQVTEAWATLGIATALYSEESWAALRLALAAAIGKNDGTTLLRLADSMVERQSDGSYSNEMEANLAVNCLDKPYPATTAAFQKDAAAAAKAAPRFGPFVVWGSLPCAYWPVKTNDQPKPLAAKGAKPILVVGTLRDPATPYKWAQGLASELSSGVLLTFDGDGHVAYPQGNECVSQAVDRYLVQGVPPRNGTTCR